MNNPFEKDETRGDPVEHLQQGVSEFMGQKEQQVRRVINSFNMVMGTEFTTTLECNQFAEENEGHYLAMVEDLRNNWIRSLEVNQYHWMDEVRKRVIKGFYIGLAIATFGGGIIGYAIGHAGF